jgi:polyisoprenyl-phosphate glycosyltransferase
MKVSIVVPVYQNELNLHETIPRLLSLKERISHDLELVFVDDGSKDHSLDILLNYQAIYPNNIVVVKLTRNFGSYPAIQAGLIKSTGDCVGVIAADMQDPPELLLEMVKNWERGIKAIFAVRSEREDPKLTKLFSNTYYSLFRRFAIPSYPKGGFDFVLIDRQVVNDINNIREKNTYLFPLIYWLGYSYVIIPYVRKKREKGKSQWTYSKRIKLAIDSFVGFSYFPIRLVSALGLVFALASFLYGAIVFYTWWMGKVPVQGFTATMIVITFVGGIQMIMLGVLGEYLWRTLDQSRNRPIYVIDRVVDSNAAQTDSRPNDNIASVKNR